MTPDVKTPENPEMAPVRPSSLPKLACCRCYESAPGTSAAAERGTRIDASIRRLYAKRQGLPWDDSAEVELMLNDEDAEAVRWALDKLDELSLDPLTDEHHAVETRECELVAAVPVPGVKTGTMDSLCVGLDWLVDFKTGQVRDYKAQMAAYALACMEAYFADEWTAHLLFVDQQEVVTHRFTAAEARELVEGIVSRPMVEELCDYCKWCGRAAECALMRGITAEAVAAPELPKCTPAAKSKSELPEALECLLADHAAAHDFLSKFAIVSDWVDVLKSKLKESVGEDDPYFKRVVVSGRRVVMPLQLSRYAMELGHDRLLKMCSPIPESKVREQWQVVFADTPMPEEMVTTQGGSVQLRLKKVKK